MIDSLFSKWNGFEKSNVNYYLIQKEFYVISQPTPEAET